ncbi:MAG: Amuc_1100 family pilus-like protein [Akkermansia sp.]|nr:Amuc_1100 family pilus-like protein [Akkermansia sp.]
MNISENKRVVALGAVFALAFGGVMYYGFSESQKHAANKEAIEAINVRFDGYANQDLVPTKRNLAEIKEAYSKVSSVNKDLQAELNRYASFCWGDGKKISAQDFQNELRESINKVKELAASQGAQVSGAAADLGLASFKNAAPVADDVPFRSFQLKAVTRVAETVLGSGAPSLEKVYCAALPAEAAESLKPNSRKPAPYFPLSFEVSFEAARGTLPKVINSIVADKDFFLTITGISVQGNDSLPGMDAYVAPAEVAAEGSDLGETASAESVGGYRTMAVRKTGAPDEKVRVYMTMQVLYFTPGKTK